MPKKASEYKQRADGRWVLKKIIKGLEKPKYFYGSSRKEAKQKYEDFMRELDKEKTVMPHVGFKVDVEGWLALIEGEVSDKTYKDYKYKANQAESYFKRYDTSEITQEDWRVYLRRYKGMSASTINVHMLVNRNICKYALSKGHTLENTFGGVKRPLAKKKIPKRYYNKEQARFVTDVAKQTNEGRMAFIILKTGARSAEACALHIKNIDLKKGVVKIRSAVKPDSGKQIVGDPKNEPSVRDIPVDNEFENKIS